jgi:hypothetical protein
MVACASVAVERGDESAGSHVRAMAKKVTWWQAAEILGRICYGGRGGTSSSALMRCWTGAAGRDRCRAAQNRPLHLIISRSAAMTVSIDSSSHQLHVVELAVASLRMTIRS